MAKEYPIVDNVESFEAALARGTKGLCDLHAGAGGQDFQGSCPRREQHAHPAGEDGGGRNRHGRGGR